MRNKNLIINNLILITILFSMVAITFVLSGRVQKTNVTQVSKIAEAETASYPLKLAGSGKNQHLVETNGKPFFINGDTAWSLIIELSREDTLLYLNDRAQKGFNFILVNLIEHRYSSHPPSNFYNNQPFSQQGNFDTPNESYFSHADWVIREAEKLGLAVLLDPIYLGYQCNDDGWCDEIRNSSLTTMRNWGRYVGNRYKNVPNIVWLIGGDEDPRTFGVADKLREVALGIKETDTNHLITAHNANGQSASDIWGNESWLDLNNVYTWQLTYPMAIEEYNRNDFKPMFLLETVYENYNNSTPVYLRSQAYWSILSGSFLGHIFGNCQIWGFSKGYCSESWKNQLNSEGSRTVSNIGKLFNSREFFNLVPDQTVIVSKSENAYVSAARTIDGHTLIIYLPSQMSLNINLTKLGGQNAKVWWYNPRDGTSASAGTFPISNSQTFTAPGSGDWILVADNSSLNFPPPGGTLPSVTLSPTPAGKPGDCDGDGFVDLFDYGYLSRSFGLTLGQAGFDARCDFHIDQFNIIDLFDYQILANNFGR